MAQEGRSYKQDEELGLDEDETHEFKNHDKFTVDNISKTSRILREIQPISRTICGFLNSGKGGTIYLGIKDNGIVHGMQLTEFQRDHMVLSLDELLKAYKPLVPRSWVDLQFIRCIPRDGPYDRGSSCPLGKYRLKPHSLGIYYPCWCSEEAFARPDRKFIPWFVVEITVKPWNPLAPENTNLVTTKTKLHPIFENEKGEVWIRTLASNQLYTMKQVYELTLKQIDDYYRSDLKK